MTPLSRGSIYVVCVDDLAPDRPGATLLSTHMRVVSFAQVVAKLRDADAAAERSTIGAWAADFLAREFNAYGD